MVWVETISTQMDYNMKNTMNSIIILILASLFFGACEKKEITPPEPPVEEKIVDIEWATRINLTKEVVATDNTLHYKDDVIAGGDIGDPSTLIAFDKYTGDKSWELEFSELPGAEVTFMYLHRNVLIGRNASLVFGFDLDAKVLLWTTNFRDMGIRLGRGTVASNGLFYQLGNLDFDPLGGHTQKIFEIDPYTGNYREVYSRAPDEAGTKSVSPPVIYDDVNNGRTLLIFNEFPNAESPPQDGKQYLVAMDLETGERVWETLVTQIFASNSLHPPVIYDDRIVITGGHDKMYGFDIVTGAKKWVYKDENGMGLAQWGKTNHLIHGDRLYVNETGKDVTCLNPENGALIWDNTEGGPNCTDNMHYYVKEDLLVFCSWGYGSVMVLDAFTGETIHREHRYDNSSYGSDVVYDEERDMFYCTTYKHAVGFTVQRVE